MTALSITIAARCKPPSRFGGGALIIVLACGMALGGCYATRYPGNQDADPSAAAGDGDGDGSGGRGNPPIPGGSTAGGQGSAGAGGRGQAGQGGQGGASGAGGAVGTGGRSGVGGAVATGGVTGGGGGGSEFDCRHGCPDGPLGLSAGCCTSGTDVPAHAALSTGQCGLELSQINRELAGLCIERNQPGVPDATCPVLNTQGMAFAGCCTSTGICGNQVDFLQLGCATVNVTIQPCGQ